MQLSKRVRAFLTVFIPLVLLVVIVLENSFFTLDSLLCDHLYERTDGVFSKIRIIAVDEETLDEYGKFETWSRTRLAQLLEILYSEKKSAPTLVALDFLLSSESDVQIDKALVDVCREVGPIVLSTNVVYRGKTKQTKDGQIYFDNKNIEMIEKPFEELEKVTKHGYANAYIGKDGCVRYTKLEEKFQEEKESSFSWMIYEIYEKSQGREPVVPRRNQDGELQFFYSGQIGEFPHFSMKDVVDGTIPLSEFEDCIVLVGAYAPGFQDAYIPAVNHGGMMYGVEINANLVQAFMEGKTAVPAPNWLYLLVSGVLLVFFFVISQKQKLIPVIIEAISFIVLHMLVGRLLALHGYTIPQLYLIVIVVFGVLYFVFEKYIMERIRKRKLLATFKTYVASEVVDELAKDDNFQTRLGGEKRNVAVLFVDIRGFTPLSESLKPEQVVKVLNEYLALTTSCILKNKGMLDKFIGDATMAVFNAPTDLDDYVFCAVKAAMDMRAGSEKLAKKLYEECGKTVSFGIGVNCGEAVIGNIGCEFRMDYTAIGDTVNTAARLESRSGKGEILISEAVYDIVKNRVEAEFVADMELKGKSNVVKTYRVLTLKE